MFKFIFLQKIEALIQSTINALRKENFVDPDTVKNLSIDEFFVHLERLCEERVRKRQSYENTIRVMLNLFQNNEHYVKKTAKIGFNVNS